VRAPTTARTVRKLAAIIDRGAPPLLDDGLEVDDVPPVDEDADASLPLLKTRTYEISKYAVS